MARGVVSGYAGSRTCARLFHIGRPLQDYPNEDRFWISLGCEELVAARYAGIGREAARLRPGSGRAEGLVGNTCAFIDNAKEESSTPSSRMRIERPGEGKLLVGRLPSRAISRELRKEIPRSKPSDATCRFIDAIGNGVGSGVGGSVLGGSPAAGPGSAIPLAFYPKSEQPSRLSGPRTRAPGPSPAAHYIYDAVPLASSHAEALRLREDREGCEYTWVCSSHPARLVRADGIDRARGGPGGAGGRELLLISKEQLLRVDRGGARPLARLLRELTRARLTGSAVLYLTPTTITDDVLARWRNARRCALVICAAACQRGRSACGVRQRRIRHAARPDHGRVPASHSYTFIVGFQGETEETSRRSRPVQDTASITSACSPIRTRKGPAPSAG